MESTTVSLADAMAATTATRVSIRYSTTPSIFIDLHKVKRSASTPSNRYGLRSDHLRFKPEC